MLKTGYILTALVLLYSIRFTANPTTITGISTDSTFTIEQLVRDHFIKGSCPNVSDIESFGNERGIGFFNNGNGVIGLSSGIIISTGDIKSAEGPNNSIETTTSFNDNAGDPDLDIFATNVVFDATGIEFSFAPLEEQVTFRYVFASEEYCEFVGSIFNDNFGFFVSGPGINGSFNNNAINVATLPGTGEYVSINTINHDSNAASYVSNELEQDTDECNIPFNASFLDLIEYDGFTTPLSATIDVIPCETYHIRLVIGDIGDDKLDSAIFLESKSFDLGGKVTVRAEVEGNDQAIAYENCRDGQFIFERTGMTDFNQAIPVNFSILPASEATPGLDFENIPTTITIPAMEQSATLPINIIADQIDELPERLILNIEHECECLDTSKAVLIISDLDSLETNYNEVFVCPGQEFSVGPDVSGGAQPYDYLWNNNNTEQYLTSMVIEPTHFTVTITDACGSTALAIVGTEFQSIPIATISGDIEFCEGDDAFLNVDFGGFSPWSITYSIDDIEQTQITGISNNPFSLPVTETGIYKLIHFEDAQCRGAVEGIGIAVSSGPNLQYDLDSPNCFNSSDGSIQVVITEGIPPYDLEWNIPVEDPYFLDSLSFGNYSLTLTDGNDCQTIYDIDIPNSGNLDPACEDYILYIPNVFSPNRDGDNDYFEVFPGENSFIKSFQNIQVFNRWGALVFEKKNFPPDNNRFLWDGRFKGKPLNPGVFIWKIILELEDGSTRLISGSLTLLH